MTGSSSDTFEEEGPKAFGDPMGTPMGEEQVLWKGRPELSLLARSAFHTRKVAFYFALLIVIAVATNNQNTAVMLVVMGIAALAILYGLAWLCVKTTLYILTDTRLIMRVGMAVEARINIPLKQVNAANLKPLGNGAGDIALQLSGERLLGYYLMWPHVRPWHFTKPQPMLRAVPDAETVASHMAEARAVFSAIERGEMKTSSAPVSDGNLEGAPA